MWYWNVVLECALCTQLNQGNNLHKRTHHTHTQKTYNTQEGWIPPTNTCCNIHQETCQVLHLLPTIPTAPPCCNHPPGTIPGSTGSQVLYRSPTRCKSRGTAASHTRVASTAGVPTFPEMHRQGTMLCAPVAGSQRAQEVEDPGTVCRPSEEAQPWNGEQDIPAAAETLQAGGLQQTH